MNKFYLLLLFLLFFACKAKESFDHITITSTGGVAGTSTSYEIRPDGDVFKINNRTGERLLHTKISKGEVDRLHMLIKALKDFDKERNQPGNMTRELFYKKGEESFRTIWEPGMGTGLAADMIYHSIIQSISKT
jgi:hypothetical protein